MCYIQIERVLVQNNAFGAFSKLRLDLEVGDTNKLNIKSMTKKKQLIHIPYHSKVTYKQLNKMYNCIYLFIRMY